ncbi:MAG: helix-turn-helix domain-containing protein [Rhizobiaceae bacterium]
MEPFSAAFLAEAVIRGALVGGLLLAAWQMLAHRPASICSWSGALFMACFAAYVILSMPGLYTYLGPGAFLLMVPATMAPVFFWWFILALVDDGFSLRPLHWCLAAAMVAIIIMRPVLPGYGSDMVEAVRVVLLLGLFGHAIWTAHQSLNEDLVPARRAFSRAFSLLAPVFGIGIALFEGWAIFYSLPAGTNYLQLAVLVILVSLFTGWLTALRGDLLPSPGNQVVEASKPDQTLDPATTRLQKLMKDGAYKTPGLTIGGLATMAKIPEHRLRSLINQQLGYRNFSAFLNDHRIDEAKRALRDPQLADKQITTIAFDLGFASLAPFNRAFRERTGTSPREYRERSAPDGSNG